MPEETHAWRVRLDIAGKAQHDLLLPALLEMSSINETWINMTIYFSMSDYAIFMVACARLDKPVDVTKLTVQIVDMKKEPNVVHQRHMAPRPILKLQHA